MSWPQISWLSNTSRNAFVSLGHGSFSLGEQVYITNRRIKSRFISFVLP